MIDLAFRSFLFAFALAIIVRAFVLNRCCVVNDSRRRSVRIMAFTTMPTALFWVVVAARQDLVDGALFFEAWLSRVASSILLAGLWGLQSIIKDAEGASNGK